MFFRKLHSCSVKWCCRDVQTRKKEKLWQQLQTGADTFPSSVFLHQSASLLKEYFPHVNAHSSMLELSFYNRWIFGEINNESRSAGRAGVTAELGWWESSGAKVINRLQLEMMVGFRLKPPHVIFMPSGHSKPVSGNHHLPAPKHQLPHPRGTEEEEQSHWWFEILEFRQLKFISHRLFLTYILKTFSYFPALTLQLSAVLHLQLKHLIQLVERFSSQHSHCSKCIL